MSTRGEFVEGLGEMNSQNPISAETIGKIQEDLDLVRTNMTVLSEMLLEVRQGEENPADLELIKELYKTCKEMQTRVAQLLCTQTTDQLTIDMLQINDDLNDLFDRYDRKIRKRPTEDAPLIDLGDEGATPSLISDLQAINIAAAAKATPPSKLSKPPKEDDVDFDQFIQARNVPKDTNLNRASGGTKEEELIHGHRETDFEEMEEWLKANPGAEASLTSIPNPQFDSYLAGRAAGPPSGDKPSS